MLMRLYRIVCGNKAIQISSACRGKAYLAPNVYRNGTYHYIDDIMNVTASQISGVSVFLQPFVQAKVKNMKAPRHWPL